MPRASTRRAAIGRQATSTSARTHRIQRRTPIDSPDGGTQIVTMRTTPKGSARTVERRTPIASGGSQFETTTESSPYRDRTRRNIRDYSPTKAGEKATVNVGLLEAEFFAVETLIIVELFTGTDPYATKIMQTMKRGMLSAILFLILALIASTGQNAAKVTKAIGAMVFVAILVSSPIRGSLTALDTFFKADWVGTKETGSDTASGQAAGTSGTTSAPAGGTASDSFAAAVNSLSAAQRASSTFMHNFTTDFIQSWNIAHPGQAISATADQLVNVAKALSDAANAGTDFIVGIFNKIF